MIFAVFDPSPLTVCINCSFFTFIFAVLLPGLSRLLIMSITRTFFDFQDGGHPPSKIFKCSKYQLLVWRAIHYYVRTYAKISVTRKFCDFSYVLLLSVCKNCLTYVQPSHDLFTERLL